MKKIKLAKNSGFCFGVKRAIRLAEETAQKHGKAITLGPIIHNPQMVENLKHKGVSVAENTDDIGDEAVIIRSHGIPRETYEILKAKQNIIIDATCPYVAKAHEFARIANSENYDIFILGNHKHPEVIALKSYIDKKVYFFESSEEIINKKFNKVAIICQTTQNIDNLIKLSNSLIPICNELRIFNTICNATNVRQNSSLELAKHSDLMIVIGGKNSSNTKMLAKLCSKYATTKHIETQDEIKNEWFANADNIGLTAGASTPDWIIIDVYNKIKVIVGDANDLVQSVDAIPGYKEESNEYECSKRP
ncbi:MAG: 4-hydroxy-3-methylbut-2-enyl diphosphate reductase [Candidatus Cloacimonetes bacterium]|jgi:4-hydroxy-3-methylbut-2-enyl diphosphate reductase|nr:4-hydroxy-3-methylbut-2-enyl diphosphate reductase [Candidatus Cloacimonadota bacterium]MDD3386834.1 4-hydroxy-3-methylbut-2-enyl diphosphate reductase [Candidatus Paceibacterota bacterium]MDD4156669.1 4-hydroxy-3-methylbut-2-enyl diphosphate reductase [Candidatus Cloacimonadota bacterium]